MPNQIIHFTNYLESQEKVDLPEKFTFPFYYDVHPLAFQAAKELQDYLISKTEWKNDLGIESDNANIGKMFGVLVVVDKEGKIGYLSAFSGKLECAHDDSRFVPSIFNRFISEGHFDIKSQELDSLSKKIDELEADLNFRQKKDHHTQQVELTKDTIADEKKKLRTYHNQRKKKRLESEAVLSSAEYEQLLERQKQESMNNQFQFRAYAEYLTNKLVPLKEEFIDHDTLILKLKDKRKRNSNSLQNWLFTQYNFLNIRKEEKNVVDIFKYKIPDIPPSGAGDCAAPKLLQYAFMHDLKPIALAEFWWGKPPKSKVRKHGNFYPACRSKCEPIMEHMLEGMEIDPNPLLDIGCANRIIETVYEDEYLLVINKPEEFLSVPGKQITDSVQERMKRKYPESTGPMIVHRLDMSTSGLMVVAKTKDVHKMLQHQFVTRKINKRYVAILDGILSENEGFINLPLILDWDNRPCQMVCYETGKSSRTRWEIIEIKDGKTKVYLYPITGRTHQLRVHSAHELGLNIPILGDDLYGRKEDRLYLHAESLEFIHPFSKEIVRIQKDENF